MVKLRFKIEIVNRNISFDCDEDENIIKGLEQSVGRDMMVGCRQGGCGICRIKIISGEYKINPMNCNHVSKEDQQNGIVLACRTIPLSDMKLEYLGLKK